VLEVKISLSEMSLAQKFLIVPASSLWVSEDTARRVFKAKLKYVSAYSNSSFAFPTVFSHPFNKNEEDLTDLR